MATKKELEADIKQLEDILNSSLETEDRQQKTNRKLLDRVKELEGYIRTLVDENPTIFCCWKCIPNAPNPPRHVVDFFGLGLEKECECKEDE